MPGPTNVPVPVVVNFNGVSYNATTKQWSGSPSFTVPPTTTITSGDNTITWTLQAAVVPQGFSATFPLTNPIVFDPGWVGGLPARQTPTTVQATDNFQLPVGSDPIQYPYAVNVSLVSNSDSTVTKTWNYDPDVENEPVIGHTNKAGY